MYRIGTHLRHLMSKKIRVVQFEINKIAYDLLFMVPQPTNSPTIDTIVATQLFFIEYFHCRTYLKAAVGLYNSMNPQKFSNRSSS